MAVLNYLLFFILLLFPFGELLRFDLGNSVAIKPIDVAVGIFAVVYVVYSLLKRRFLHRKELLIFCLFPLIGLISLLVNATWLKTNELLVASLYLARWVVYASLYFFVQDLKLPIKKRLQLFLLLNGIVIELVGFVQLVLSPSLWNLYYQGWDEHLFRIFSVFLDPNFTGAFYVLFFILVAGLLYNAQKKKQKKSKICLSTLLVLTLLAIFFTFSRSALFMLLVSSAVFLSLIQKKRLLIGLIGILLLSFVLISPLFYIENLNLFRTASSKARLGTYVNALKIIGDRPVFGVGFDAYRYAQIAYHFRDAEPRYPSHADAGVDNSFLFVLATTGFVGFIAYLYIWYLLLQRALTAFRKHKDVFALISIASATGLFVDALFINSLFYPALFAWVLIIFGLIESS